MPWPLLNASLKVEKEKKSLNYILNKISEKVGSIYCQTKSQTVLSRLVVCILCFCVGLFLQEKCSFLVNKGLRQTGQRASCWGHDMAAVGMLAS